MEIAACLDIREDSYTDTVVQKAYGVGRIYGDGGEPYGGTLGDQPMQVAALWHRVLKFARQEANQDT